MMINLTLKPTLRLHGKVPTLWLRAAPERRRFGITAYLASTDCLRRFLGQREGQNSKIKQILIRLIFNFRDLTP